MTPKQATRDAQLSFLVVDAVETSANGSPPLGKNSLIFCARMTFSQLSNMCFFTFLVFKSLGNFSKNQGKAEASFTDNRHWQ